MSFATRFRLPGRVAATYFAGGVLLTSAATAADPPASLPTPPADRRLQAYGTKPVVEPAAAQAPVQPPAATPPPPRLPAVGGPAELPKPTPLVQARYDRFIDQIVDSDNVLDLAVNRTRLIVLKAAPKRVQVADDSVVGTTVVSPKELSVGGKKVGTTTLTLWFPDPADATREVVLSYLVRVLPDPETRRRADLAYDALAAEVNRAFPDSAIKLQFVGDKLVVRGHAKDVHDAYQILRVVRANAPADPTPANPQQILPAGATDGVPDLGAAGGPDVVNLLKVGGEHQVMLKVTVAEVNRAAARTIGVNFNIARQDGLVVFANRTGNLGTASGLLANGQASPLNNLPVVLGGGQVAAAVNALRSLNLAKSLAEPNLVTLNGRTASFQAGGQFPIPVVTGFTSAGLQGVSFVPFGVGLQFTPVVTDDDRVRLTVAADVSTRDTSTAASNVGGTSVPSLSTRNFQTTVELRSGETLAVAGLIQSNFGSDATRVPFFGDLPAVGRLFAFDRTSNAEQELVVLITPQLVHPLGPNDPQPIPGCDLLPPSDVEFYLLGRLQAHCPTGTDTSLMDPAAARKVRKLERQLLVGPVGHTIGHK